MKCSKCRLKNICKYMEPMQKQYDDICKIVTYGTPEIKCDTFEDETEEGLEVPEFLSGRH